MPNFPAYQPAECCLWSSGGRTQRLRAASAILPQVSQDRSTQEHSGGVAPVSVPGGLQRPSEAFGTEGVQLEGLRRPFALVFEG